jgi:hypothetical protein
MVFFERFSLNGSNCFELPMLPFVASPHDTGRAAIARSFLRVKEVNHEFPVVANYLAQT